MDDMTHSLISDDWKNILSQESRASLESLLPETLKTKRWFGGKTRTIASTSVSEAIPIPYGSSGAQLLFVRVAFTEGPPETYLLPLTMAHASKARWIRKEFPNTIYTSLPSRDNDPRNESLLFDPLWDPNFSSYLLETMVNGRHLKGLRGTLVGSTTKACKDLLQDDPSPTPAVMKTEQSNTSIAYGTRVILKLYRRLGEGANPDLEIGRLLTQMNFPHIPHLSGSLEYQREKGESITVGLLQQFVENEGDAWNFTLRSLESFFDRVQSKRSELPVTAGPDIPLLDLSYRTIPPPVQKWIGAYLDSAKLLGQCTAELHQALSQHPSIPEFSPEPISREYLVDRHHSMTELTTNTLNSLEKHLPNLPHDVRNDAQEILQQQDRIFQYYEDFLTVSHSCMRIRCHGDFHLGQVLWTGRKFMIIDFEGEPARSLRERKMKHSPIIDVTGMLRSFHYAPYAALHQRLSGAGSLENEQQESMLWAEFWYQWVSASFLRGYLPLASSTAFWPSSWRDTKILFDTYLMEKAVYELAYELNNRPDWVIIPLQGLRHLLNPPKARHE